MKILCDAFITLSIVNTFDHRITYHHTIWFHHHAFNWTNRHLCYPSLTFMVVKHVNKAQVKDTNIWKPQLQREIYKRMFLWAMMSLFNFPNRSFRIRAKVKFWSLGCKIRQLSQGHGKPLSLCKRDIYRSKSN